MNQQELFDRWPPIVVPKANEPAPHMKHWSGSALECLERQRKCFGCPNKRNMRTLKDFTQPAEDYSCRMPFVVQTLIDMGKAIPTILTNGPAGGFLRRGERL